MRAIVVAMPSGDAMAACRMYGCPDFSHLAHQGTWLGGGGAAVAFLSDLLITLRPATARLATSLLQTQASAASQTGETQALVLDSAIVMVSPLLFITGSHAIILAEILLPPHKSVILKTQVVMKVHRPRLIL